MRFPLTSLLCALITISTFAQDHITMPVGPPPKFITYEDTLLLGKLYLIPANPEKGFHWPYYLSTPKESKNGTALLVQPNNDGKAGAPYETHDYWASIIAEQTQVDYGRELGGFALVPVFPRPDLENGNNLYVHALTRAVIENESDSLKRIDLQLISMIDDAQEKIRKIGIDVPEKVMLWGFSAAGDFVTRMAMIHPERVKCLVAGGLGGFPILPMTTFQNESLTYPVGVYDFRKLFGKNFNATAFKQIPMKFFQGGEDENDSIAEGKELRNKDKFQSDSYDYDQCVYVNNTFGENPVDRIKLVNVIYRGFGVKQFEYVVIPGIEHVTEPFEDQVLAFLKMHSK